MAVLLLWAYVAVSANKATCAFQWHASRSCLFLRSGCGSVSPFGEELSCLELVVHPFVDFNVFDVFKCFGMSACDLLRFLVIREVGGE